MRRIVIAAMLLLVACARLQADAECQEHANRWRVQTVVQDQVCTTGRGVFGGLVTTCQAVPRVAYAETELGRSNYRSCMLMRGYAVP